MRYYTITSTDDINEIGNFPQIIFNEEYNPELPTSHRSVQSGVFATFVPKIIFSLNKGATKTSFIDNILPFGLIVDENFKNVLEKLTLPEFRFYPVIVNEGDFLHTYYWFYYLNDSEIQIDYSKSQFTRFNKFSFSVVEDDLSFSNIIDLRLYQKALPSSDRLKIKSIVVESSLCKYDLFDITIFGRITLISERAAKLLTDGSLNGFKLKEYDSIKCK